MMKISSTGVLILFLAVSAQAQTRPAIPPADEATFRGSLESGKPGDVLLTPVTQLDSIAPLPIAIAPAQTQTRLLLSDKPEYFRTGNGIAMQETIEPGRSRLYAYHVPVPQDGPKQVLITLENLADAESILTRRRVAEIAPGGDYHQIARSGMRGLLEDETEPTTLRIPPRSTIELYRSPTVSRHDLLVHWLCEFEISARSRVTVAQVDAGASAEAVNALPKLPTVLPGTHASGAGRGTFPVTMFDVTSAGGVVYDTTSGPRAVIVADGKTDPWIKGTDGLEENAEIQNKGNYGTVYHLRIPVKSSDGKRLAVLMAQQRTDSQWCQAVAAVVRVGEQIVALPRDTVRFRNVPEMVLIEKVDLKVGAGVIDIRYTPPGASCLPTPIILMPY